MTALLGQALRRLRGRPYLRETIRQLYTPLLRLSYRKSARRAFLRRLKALRVVEIPERPSTNLLFVVIDCFRYRNTPLAGYPRETTPFLASFKAKGKLVSAAPWTPPSVASLLSGLYPHSHGVDMTAEVRRMEETPPKQMEGWVLTLPELLIPSGYRFYFGVGVEFAECFMRGRVFPYTYYFSWEPVGAEQILEDFKRWLSEPKEPFFAYLHLTDTHEPFRIPPEPFDRFFGKVERAGVVAKGFAFARRESQWGRAFELYKESRILLYDNILRYLDHLVEDLYGFLERKGLLDRTVLTVTGDHGEEFWEHAELEAKYFYDPRGWCGVGHAHNVFNELIEVPLFVDGALPRGFHLPETSSAVDLFPTILDLLGIRGELDVDGRSALKGGSRIFLSESVGYGYEKKALIAGRYKLLWSEGDGVRWVFDLEKDPYEQDPIEDGELFEKLMAALQGLLAEGEKRRVRMALRRLKLPR